MGNRRIYLLSGGLLFTKHSWLVHRWESLVLVLMYLVYIVIMK